MIHFLHPIFLYGLFALVVPVILHLFSFKRYKKVYFSNFNFLESLQQEKKNSSRIKNLLLLLLRLMIIALVVMAFAGPYIAPERRQAAHASPRSQVILYMDNSFSMTNSGAKGSLFEEAKNHLFDIITTYPAGTEFALVTNDDASYDFLTREQALTTLSGMKPGPYAKTLSQVYQEAREFSREKPATLFVISDFQTHNCDFQNIAQDSLIETIFLMLTPENTNNLYISDVKFEQALHKKNQSDRISITTANSSSKDAYNIPLTLTINDKKKSINKINIPKNGNALTGINYLNTDEGFYKGIAEISDFPVVFDNKFYFSYAISGKTEILYISGNTHNPYFGKLFSDTTSFSFTSTSINRTANLNLSRFNLIILDGGSSISSGFESSLEEFVVNGGNLFILPDIQASAQGANRLLQKLRTPVYGAKDTNTVISHIETQAALFKDVFEQPDERAHLPYAQSFYQISLQANTEKLLGDKRNHPLLTAQSFGKGYVYVSAFSYAPGNSDMVFHPLFVPLMVNMAVDINSGLNTSYFLNSEKPVKINHTFYTENIPVRIRNEAGTFEFIPEIRKDFSGDLILTNANSIREAGLYEVVQEDRIIDILAYNYDRRESQMDFCREDELRKYFGKSKIENIKTSRLDLNSELVKEIVLQDNNKYLTPWFLLLAVIFLILEQLVWKKRLM